jgi:hypothetical protein
MIRPTMLIMGPRSKSFKFCSILDIINIFYNRKMRFLFYDKIYFAFFVNVITLSLMQYKAIFLSSSRIKNENNPRDPWHFLPHRNNILWRVGGSLDLFCPNCTRYSLRTPFGLVIPLLQSSITRNYIHSQLFLTLLKRLHSLQSLILL